MNIPKGKARWFLLGFLICLPGLLLLKLRKVAHVRPHLAITEELPLWEISLSKDGKSVCALINTPDPMDGDEYHCWDRNTLRKFSAAQVSQVFWAPAKKYGALSVRDYIHGGVFYCEGSGSVCSKSENYGSSLAAYSSDRKYLTLAQDDEISRWDLEKGVRLRKILLSQPQGGDCRRVVADLSPDGTLCAISNTYQSQEKFEVMECRSGKIIAQTPATSFSVYSDCFFSSDGRTLVVWTRKQVKFFDTHTAKLLWNFNYTGDTDYYLWHLPTPHGLVGIPSDRGFDFFDTRTGRLERHFAQPSLSEVQTWNLSSDGKQMWWANRQSQIFWRDLD